MFVTEGLALYIIGLEFIFGTLIGLVVASLIYRSRIRVRIASLITLPSGFAFLIATGLSGWASFPTAIWSNHLEAAGYLAAHAISLSVLSSVAASATISACISRRSK